MLDPYDLLPNRRFWIRSLVDRQLVEDFTGETITIAEGKAEERQPQSAPLRKAERKPSEPEDLGD